jgi:hypothetical protein
LKRLPYLLSTLLALPGLFTGFVLDDWMQRGVISRAFTHVGPWDLFTFATGDPARFWPMLEVGLLPWFSLPELKISFFRPLSAALTHLDVALFGNAPFPAHVHSLLWALVMLAAAQRLYQKAVPGLALLAAILFAIDRSHAMPVAWLSNRNSIVATALVTWGLVAHLSWREEGRRSGLVLSMIAWAAALCSAEAALGALAYVPAYELFGRDDDWRTRARALLPVMLLGLVFVVIYRETGSGAWGGATYIDPVQEPLVFLQNAPPRLLALLGAWTSGLPADIWITTPRLRPLLIGAGVLSLPLWPVAWRWLRLDGEPEVRAVKWLAAGAFAGVLPFLAAFPMNRLLLGSSLGLAAVLALVLRAAWRARRWSVVAWVGLGSVVASLGSWVLVPYTLSAWRQTVTRAALHPKGVESLSGRRVVVIDSSDLAIGMYTVPALATEGRPLPKSWYLLSAAMRAHRVTRLDDRRFTLEIHDGRILDTVFEQNARADRFPLKPGDVVTLQAMSVTVLSTDQDKPNAIEVALLEPPEAYTFMRWDGEQLALVELPAPGQALELPRAPAVMERILGPQ